MGLRDPPGWAGGAGERASQVLRGLLAPLTDPGPRAYFIVWDKAGGRVPTWFGPLLAWQQPWHPQPRGEGSSPWCPQSWP